MSVLLFAIFDADAGRSRVAAAEQQLVRAQAKYDTAERIVKKRASSRSTEVRQRAHQALTAALDVLDECRAALESEQARTTNLEQAEREAYALARRPQESAALRQHRQSHEL